MSACEICWAEASRKSLVGLGDTADLYKAMLATHPEHEQVSEARELMTQMFDAFREDALNRLASKIESAFPGEWEKARQQQIADWQAGGGLGNVRMVPPGYLDRKLDRYPIAGEQCRVCNGRVSFDGGYKHFDTEDADHPVAPMALNKTLDSYYNPLLYQGGDR